MLASANSLSQSILSLQPTTDETAGMTSFVKVISDFMDQAQAGPTGTPGIFALDDDAMINILKSLPVVADNSWISGFADAWEAGVNMAVITPGTVTNPVWSSSGNLDTETLPTGAATITTIAAAKTILMNELQNATAGNNPAVPFATAIRDATLAFIFTCIGLGTGPSPIPLPIAAE